jgi:ubiquinone/menaquinone biosynthesis C-methylase UbiE
MTTGRAFGELWSRGARDWASYVEPQYQLLYETVHDRLGIRNGTRLLDVGCGPGGARHSLLLRGAQVAGLDASPDSIEAARERIPTGDFRVGDMEGLPWPDGAFDVVTGFNSFQFAGKPVVALAEVRRVLGSAGSLPVAKRPPFPTSRAAQAKQQEFHCSIASSSGEWRHQLPRIRQRFQSPNCRQ